MRKRKKWILLGGARRRRPPLGSANDQQPRYKYNVENKLNSQLGKDQFTLVVMVIVTSPNNGTIDFCSATTKKDFVLYTSGPVSLKERLLYTLNKLFVKQVKSCLLLLDLDPFILQCSLHNIKYIKFTSP